MLSKDEQPKKRRARNARSTDPLLPPYAPDARCGTPRNEREREIDWFSEEKAEWTELKKICNSGCPVKRECLQYALDSAQTYGVWGGADPIRIRIALGVNAGGSVHDYEWDVICPNCGSKNVDQASIGKRRIKQCVCQVCGIEWVRKVLPKSQRKKAS